MPVSQKPKFDHEVVYEFMGAAHNNVDRIKEMIAEDADLANAAMDVGGNFETALGGAAHMGRADIAEVLLAHGARMDIFCAAMMGKMALVKAFIEDDPNVVHLKGPHGIPLIKHAEKGGQDEMVELLKSHGA